MRVCVYVYMYAYITYVCICILRVHAYAWTCVRAYVSVHASRSLRGGQTQRGSNLHTTYMDSQRAAGQGEAKAQQNPQPQAPPYGRLGVAVGRPVGFGVRFRIALAGRALRINA